MKPLMSAVYFISLLHASSVFASDGDRSSFYHGCVKACIAANCTQGGASFTETAAKKQDQWSWLLRWNCRDECQYQCMWSTVRQFREIGLPTPKFYGKWPFVRMFGVQEPASAFCSFLNLAVHVYMHTELTRQFSTKTTPLVLFWHVFAAVCMNAWVWSTIFHTRDNPFTEFMDYACASSMVMALFIAAIVRILHRKRRLTAIVVMFPLLFYATHVRYLNSRRIDYDYNMIVNVSFGAVGSLIWFAWAAVQYRAGRRYSWRMVAFTLLSGAALTLELFDFPPKYNAWDAHALWHLCTVPLPVLFYRFVFDDLHYLQTGDIKTKGNLKVT